MNAAPPSVRRSCSLRATHGLLAVARNPEIRVWQIAEDVGVTGRSAYRLLADLVAAGYVRRSRVGTRNHYELNAKQPLSDPIAGPHTLGDLIAFVEDEEP